MPPSTVTTITRYAGDSWSPPHAHAYTNLSVILGGGLVERVGPREASAGPLRVVIKPAGTRHSDLFGRNGATILRLILPEAVAKGLPALASDLAQWRWIDAPVVARWLLRVATSPEADGCIDATMECLAGLRVVEGQRAPGSPPRWLALVRERIEDEAGRGLRVTRLAAEAGVHPVYLARRFRRHFGSSVSAALQHARLRRAADLLADGDVAPSHVAYDTGFADQPHLTRAFRSLLGTTPQRYRVLCQRSVGFVQSPDRTVRVG